MCAGGRKGGKEGGREGGGWWGGYLESDWHGREKGGGRDIFIMLKDLTRIDCVNQIRQRITQGWQILIL